MAFGIPVVTNRGLAMSELVDDGQDGFIVESVDEAADRVRELLTDPERHRRMSVAAWEKSKTLSWQSHADRLRALMEDSLS